MDQMILGVTQEDTLQFFLSNMKRVLPERYRRTDEVLFVASILAHYAQTSTSTRDDEIPPLLDLTGVFDHFFCQGITHEDRELSLTAGAQCLFLNGFFRDQMRARHNPKWFDELGRGFFWRSSFLDRNRRKKDLLERIGHRFPFWAITCRNLARQFRDDCYELRLK